MKKVVSFVIAFVIFASASAIGATAFVDVPEDAYYAEAAQRMNEMGILIGSEGRYDGDANITRAQMAVVAVRLLGEEDIAKSIAGTTKFTDFTPALDWATGYVNYVTVKEIMVGDGDGIFRPNDTVKYEEVIKIVVCVLGLDENVKIDPSDWSKEYIEAAENAGLLKGLIGKKGEPMKRSDIAVICSASIDVLENGVPEVTTEATTTNKPEATTKVTTTEEEDEEPDATTKATTAKDDEEEPEVTTAATTDEEEEPEDPEVTTKATTAKDDEEEPEVTTAATTDEEETTVRYDEENPDVTLGENELPILWD